jgi:hypothetical protein
MVDNRGYGDDDLWAPEADPGGYWDDDLWEREDDPIAAELWANPDLPRKLLYWSGALEHRTLQELASAWL